MPASSSSGWAVIMMRLARVPSFLRLCQRAAVPRSIGSSRSSGAGRMEVAHGVCARALAAARIRQATARRMTAKISRSEYPRKMRLLLLWIALADFPLVRTLELKGTTHHVQGIDFDDSRLWVTSVDRTAKKGY